MKNFLRKWYWLQSQEGKKETPITAVSVSLTNFLGKISSMTSAVNFFLIKKRHHVYFMSISGAGDHLYKY